MVILFSPIKLNSITEFKTELCAIFRRFTVSVYEFNENSLAINHLILAGFFVRTIILIHFRLGKDKFRYAPPQFKYLIKSKIN